MGLSERAHAVVKSIDLTAVRAAPGVVAVLTAADIPGENDCGPIVHDDPILADGVVQYVGQPMFAVVADSFGAARRAARRAKVDYEVLPAVLTPQEAKRQQSYVLPPVHVTRGDADAALARAPRRLSGTVRSGGQDHFYLEGQIALAVPQESGGMHVQTSTQHPGEVQHIWEVELPIRGFRPPLPQLASSPDGLELTDVYALTIKEDAGLEIHHIELRPREAAKPPEKQ